MGTYVVEGPDERIVHAELARLTAPSGNVQGLVERLALMSGCDLRVTDEAGTDQPNGIELVAGTERIGFLRVTPGRSASPHADDLLRIGAPVLAVEMIKARAALERTWSLQGSLLEALIDAGPALPESLLLRAERHAVDLTAPWRLAVIETLDQEALPEGLAEAAARPSNPCERSLSCLRGEQLVVAVLADEEGSLQIKLRHLTRLARGRGAKLRAGVSSPGVEFGRELRQAQAALDLARRSADPINVFHDEMGALRFLLDAPRTHEMVALVTEELGALAARDATRNGELLSTLRVFLDACGNRSRTAELCHVHISTIKYRLKSIEEILGCDLDLGHIRFRLMLALEVREVLRTLGADPLPA